MWKLLHRDVVCIRADSILRTHGNISFGTRINAEKRGNDAKIALSSSKICLNQIFAVILHPSVLAKPLNNAQIVRGVFCLFDLPIDVFESWLTIIAVTRNACGHHARIWNKQNAIAPTMLNRPLGPWITRPTDPLRIYFDLCIIKYFLDVISPNNDMLAKLRWLFVDFPEIDLRAMGFPIDWELEPLWQ